MTMTTVPLSAARTQLSRIIDETDRTHELVEVTKKGRRAAVIMSADHYDALIETLDIVRQDEALAEIRQADADIAEGRLSTLAEAQAGMRVLGRLSE